MNENLIDVRFDFTGTVFGILTVVFFVLVHVASGGSDIGGSLDSGLEFFSHVFIFFFMGQGVLEYVRK